MVEGEYSLTSHLPVLKQPTAWEKIQSAFRQGLKFRIYIELQKLNTKGTKLPINKRTGEGNRLWAPS